MQPFHVFLILLAAVPGAAALALTLAIAPYYLLGLAMQYWKFRRDLSRRPRFHLYSLRPWEGDLEQTAWGQEHPKQYG